MAIIIPRGEANAFFNQRTERLIPRRDFTQGGCLVELGELLIKLGRSRQEEALTFFRHKGRRSLSLLTSAATSWDWQSQPRSEKPQFFQMLLAIPLQSLSPPFEFFLFVRQQSSDP